MKKSLNVLLTVTMVFLGVIIGVFIGRNSAGTWITLNPSSGNSVSGNELDGNPATPGKVNINTAGIKELTLLPGIGTSKAERILAFRNEYGSFTSITDLIYVDGFSYAVIEELRPYITVGG